MNARAPLTLGLAIALAATLAGCNEKVKTYQKKPAATGKAANIPPVPQLPQLAKKEGDNYTVFGLIHDLHSKVHMSEVKKKRVTVTGVIVKTNLVKCKNDKDAIAEGCTPECAVPPKDKEAGKWPTPPDCISPPPTFWIGDKPDDKNLIAVMGWAGKFEDIKWAIDAMDKAKDLEEQATVEYNDGGRTLPNPLPAVGAKVEITTEYQATYKGFGKPEAEPKFGILGPSGGEKLIIKILSPAPEQATLPYMAERKVLKSGGDKDKDKDKKDKKP